MRSKLQLKAVFNINSVFLHPVCMYPLLTSHLCSAPPALLAPLCNWEEAGVPGKASIGTFSSVACSHDSLFVIQSEREKETLGDTMPYTMSNCESSMTSEPYDILSAINSA